jgi:hypothetical protein
MIRYTRWFKYGRDYLCVNKSQFVPVIFEPPCRMFLADANKFCNSQNSSPKILGFWVGGSRRFDWLLCYPNFGKYSPNLTESELRRTESPATRLRELQNSRIPDGLLNSKVYCVFTHYTNICIQSTCLRPFSLISTLKLYFHAYLTGFRVKICINLLTFPCLLVTTQLIVSLWSL